VLRQASPRALAKARGLLATLRIEAASELDLELVAAHLGVAVAKRRLTGCDGRLLRSGNTAMIIVDDRAYLSAKWRFTIAHELGHFLLHEKLDTMRSCTERDLHAYHSTGAEPEANAFAAEFLMPSQLFAKLCDVKRPSMTIVRRLAERFATSLAATAIRFVECCPEPCAVVYAEERRIKWWTRGNDFKLWLERGEELSPGTYAADIFAGRQVDDRMQLTDSGEWSSDASADDIELHEHPIALSALGGVLTLLWQSASGATEED
jgi:Zn-dependent peptidase ImmA (M78 family)